MADERFATKIQEADANEPGLVLQVEDDLSTTLLTPGGKSVPVDLTGGGGGGGAVDSVTAADGTITIGGTAADPTVAVDEIATANIANGAVTAAKVAADVATQAELDAVSAAAVLKALYNANTVLVATADDTPVALTMAASTMLARLAAGDIVAATPAQIAALLAPLLPGYQFDRVQKTTDSTSTATTAATATTFLTGASVAYDGATPVRIIVSARDFFNSAAAATAVNIWRGSTDLGIVAATGVAANTLVPLSGEVQDTPPAGAHVYTARLWVTSASTGTVRGGAGGAGATVPHVMRVVRV